MGGTFDPIHLGHLVAAEWAADYLSLSSVLFVPAGDPWQKTDHVVTAGVHRLAMTSLAVTDEPRFSVSDVDLERDGPTYAVDTLGDLGAAHPDADLFFIVGADALNAIMTWHAAERLFELAHFVACARPDSTLDPAVVEQIPADRLTLLEIPGLNISSTQLRQRVRDGGSIRYLVPEMVAEYITTHGLYRATI